MATAVVSIELTKAYVLLYCILAGGCVANIN